MNKKNVHLFKVETQTYCVAYSYLTQRNSQK